MYVSATSEVLDLLVSGPISSCALLLVFCVCALSSMYKALYKKYWIYICSFIWQILNKTYLLHRIESKIQPSWNLETIQSNVPRHHWSPCSSQAGLHNPNVGLLPIYLPMWNLSSSHFQLFCSLTCLDSICSTCRVSFLCWSLCFSCSHFPWLTWSSNSLDHRSWTFASTVTSMDDK